ncbi:TetR/AcrR family transcriptional regulator [Actinacidiphila sp. ITFR-21]|uniref:TetR/AcrR family transcriptional regulator n=1 Tax=Actinacidiphila sp. ITFR-21 TaxID=3075199 RepID=UPI00288C28D0|nr:TetR/AcrR family transcriptional regulator [Streptomyces sp. ITFR-21]WNI18622.1 TetR/AcrR family transcriptional regulator [Streptomyces sp. ITFR-21]
MAGRPRVVADADLVRAAVTVIGQVGPEGLTLGAVARQAGVVAGTLVQRFGSKRGLLLAVADRSAAGLDELHARVRERHREPLDTLRELVVAWAEPLATPESYANHLAFLCVDLTDPEFHERALAMHRRQRAAVGSLLGEAAAAGRLRPATDPEELAGTVLALTSGAGLMWALDRAGGLPQRLRDAVDTALRPHLST